VIEEELLYLNIFDNCKLICLVCCWEWQIAVVPVVMDLFCWQGTAKLVAKCTCLVSKTRSSHDAARPRNAPCRRKFYWDTKDPSKSHRAYSLQTHYNSLSLVITRNFTKTDAMHTAGRMHRHTDAMHTGRRPNLTLTLILTLTPYFMAVALNCSFCFSTVCESNCANTWCDVSK